VSSHKYIRLYVIMMDIINLGMDLEKTLTSKLLLRDRE